MSSPPVVYLDTQDYSRFGDVLRGKSDTPTEELFNMLEAQKCSGNVIFAISMPILGELLQYNADYRETTLKKAEAVERVCDGWALAYPSRLIAAEIAMASQRLGLLPTSANISVLSDDWYWYPNIAGSFDDLNATITQTLDTEVAALNSRSLRRRAAKQLRNVDFAKIARAAAPEIAAKYELPVEAITASIVACLRGTITSAEASRRFFAYLSEPKNFVGIYFEKIESDRTLPQWIRGFGERLHTILTDLRDELSPFKDIAKPTIRIQTMFAELAKQLGRKMIKLGFDDTAEFGVDAALSERFATEPALVAEIQASEIISAVVEAYVSKITGLRGGAEAKIEESFGGDLIHALYLPHVDLWRGDRGFSSLLKNALPRYASRVVTTLNGLPAQIDACHKTATR